MPHPLLHLIAGRPHLLLEHLEAYGELISAEAAQASAGWKRSALLNAVALVLLLAGVVLGGVAVMLWGAIPRAQMPAPATLLLVPFPPIVLAVWCLLVARRASAGEAFEHLRRQMKADMALLREAGAP